MVKQVFTNELIFSKEIFKSQRHISYIKKKKGHGSLTLMQGTQSLNEIRF